MRNLLRFILLLVLAFGIAGCRSYVIVNGKKVETLSEAEEAQLLAYARAIVLHQTTLKPAKRLNLTPEEIEFIRTRDPEVKIDYMDDRLGRYVYDWELSPKKTLRITFGGELLTKKMVVRAQIFQDSCGGERGNNVRLISR